MSVRSTEKRMLEMIDKKRLVANEVSIIGEAEYIVQCAGNRDARVVTLGQLLFFSTRSGDAWMFDPADQTARPLVLEGEVLPLGITETAQSFQVEWTASYQFLGDILMISLNSGRVVASLHYPAREIKAAIRRMGM